MADWQCGTVMSAAAAKAKARPLASTFVCHIRSSFLENVEYISTEKIINKKIYRRNISKNLLGFGSLLRTCGLQSADCSTDSAQRHEPARLASTSTENCVNVCNYVFVIVKDGTV